MVGSEVIPHNDGPEGSCPVGLFTPCLPCRIHGCNGVIIEVICINDTIDRLSAIGDPVASIGGEEECHANLNDSGVGGVLDESGVHGVVV